MRSRALLAGFLTAMLLFTLPAVSNCEIKCDVASLGSACHAASRGNKSQPASMSSMAGMQHGSVSGTGVAHHYAFASQQTACQHYTCAQQPGAVQSRQDLSRPVSVAFEAILPKAVRFTFGPTPGETSSRGPPAFLQATPVSLHTTLLV